MTGQDRDQRGIAKRRELLGVETEHRTAYLRALAADLERMVLENLFGESYCRPGLAPRGGACAA